MHTLITHFVLKKIFNDIERLFQTYLNKLYNLFKENNLIIMFIYIFFKQINLKTFNYYFTGAYLHKMQFYNNFFKNIDFATFILLSKLI